MSCGHYQIFYDIIACCCPNLNTEFKWNLDRIDLLVNLYVMAEESAQLGPIPDVQGCSRGDSGSGSTCRVGLSYEPCCLLLRC